MRWPRRRVLVGVVVLALAGGAGAVYFTDTSVPESLPGPLSSSESPSETVRGYWADIDAGELDDAANRTNDTVRPNLPLDSDNFDLDDLFENESDDRRLLAAQLDSQVNITLSKVTVRSQGDGRAAVFAEVRIRVLDRREYIVAVLHELVRQSGEWVIADFESDYVA